MRPLPGWSTVTDAIAALTQSLAPPVARGMLSSEGARAAIAMAVIRAAKAGDDISGQVGIWLHVLEINVCAISARHNLIAHQIRRTIKPMIIAHHPWRSLMAMAHDLNGEAGFPLPEAEVSEIVRIEVWFSLPPAPTGRSAHAR